MRKVLIQSSVMLSGVLVLLLASIPSKSLSLNIQSQTPLQTASEPVIMATDPSQSARRSPNGVPDAVPKIPSPYDDEFDSSNLDPKWSWIREDPSHWSLIENPGHLRIVSQRGGFAGGGDVKNILVEPAPPGDFEVTVEVSFLPTENWQTATVLVYEDDVNFFYVGRRYHSSFGGCSVVGASMDQGNLQEDGIVVPCNLSPTGLRITKSGSSYRGEYRDENGSWIHICEWQLGISADYLGLEAHNGHSTASEIPADFDFIRVSSPPVLNLPFNYEGRHTGWSLYFLRAFIGRTSSVFDHDLPNNIPDHHMLPYLGYNAESFPTQAFPCGPPNYRCYDGHDGYDFTQRKAGEKVLAAAAGIVVDSETGCGFCLGCQVTIDHGNGFKTIYGHLRDEPTVTGEVVAGEEIGTIGCTYNPPCQCTGPHIHFEVQYNDRPIDPSGWKDGLQPDPWASDPNGAASGHLWRHPVPIRQGWLVDGALGASMTTDSGDIEIEVPPGAFSGSLEFLFTDAPVAEPSDELKPVGYSFVLETGEILQSGDRPLVVSHADATSLRPTPRGSFSMPLTVTIRYSDTLLGGLDEETLKLYMWDEGTLTWTPLATTLDMEADRAVANSDVAGLFALLVDDNDTQGPAIGQPVFEDTVLSSEWLTVTVAISDTLSGDHGVDSARLYYSYTVPYTQTQVVGWGPGGSGDGMWTFVIPPQGTAREGETLKFSLQAIDGDLSPVSTSNDNEGDYFAVTIVSPIEQHSIYLPLIIRNDS